MQRYPNVKMSKHDEKQHSKNGKGLLLMSGKVRLTEVE